MVKKQETYEWDKYTQEAEIEPFRLRISDDETLVFEAPSGIALIRIMHGLRDGDIEAILVALTGDKWDRMRELFGDVGHKALPNITEDMLDHFDLYEPVTLEGPGGGRVKAKRPREIQALLNSGYRPVGEANSRT